MGKFIWIVLKKELVDIFRDKKTWLVGMLIPALLIPILMMVMTKGMQSAMKRQHTNVAIALEASSDTEVFQNFVKNTLFSFKDEDIDLELISVQDVEKALENEEIRAALIFSSDFFSQQDLTRTSQITIIYNEAKSKSQAASTILRSLLQEYVKQTSHQRLSNQGINPEILDVVSIEYKNVATQSETGGAILAMILPIFFVLWPLVGSITAGPDLGAGEKERGTLEPLLTTQPSRIALVLGKYLAVLLCSLLSVIASALGIIGIIVFMPEAMAVIQKLNISISLGAIVIIFVMSILLSGMFSAFVLALSVYARSFKEAQTYVSPLTIIAIFPVYGMMMLEASDLSTWHFIVPIVNAVAIFKEAFINQFVLSHILLALGSSIVFMLLSIAFCIGMFKKESVLFRS